MSLAAPRADEEGPAALNRALMTPWLKDMEGAVVKGTGLWSNDPQNLHRMIDQVVSSSGRAATSEARKAFGEGGHGYFDYDFLALMRHFLKAMPQGQAETALVAFGKATSTAPMVFAVTFAEGRARVQAQIPLEPFEQMAKQGR